MKKILVFVLVLAILSCLFASCEKECDHDWVDADCTTPKICDECGKTKGEALGHEWTDASCEMPKTCGVCGKTIGKKLEHTEGEKRLQSIDAVNATAIYTISCTECNKLLDETNVELQSFCNDNAFILTPKQFSERLSAKLKEIADVSYDVSESSFEGVYVCNIYSNVDKKFVGTFYFVDDHYEKISYDQGKSLTFSGVAGAVFYEDDEKSDEDYANLINILSAFVLTCDPTISYDYNFVMDTMADLILVESTTINGIEYVFDAEQLYFGAVVN